MQEEDGEEDTEHKKRESDEIGREIGRCVEPDRPGHIADIGDSHVDVSESVTETDSRIITTKASGKSGESEEGNRGEDNEGGLSVEDLEGGFISEVQSGDEGEQQFRQD